jgi:hypothetical protein
VGFLRRLDEVDRRLGLHPRAAGDEHRQRWTLVFVAVALVYMVAGVTLLLVGRSEWIIGLNLAAMGAFLIGGCAVVISQFRRRRAR